MAIEKNNIEPSLEDQLMETPDPSAVGEEVTIIEEGAETTADEQEPEFNFAENIAERLSDNEAKRLADDLIADYRNDVSSRTEWEDTITKGLDLLGVKYNPLNRPFKGASGVTHPMLNEACVQFQAQAYKELLPPDGPVRAQIVGSPTPEKEQQASRVKDYMNYLLMEKMEEYTTDVDQMLYYLPLTGSTFKKVYYDEILDRPVSKYIHPRDLVVPYYATDLSECERITQVMQMTENEILKKMKLGIYLDLELQEPQPNETRSQKKINELEGIKPTYNELLYDVLEMHVDLDLEEYTSDVPKKEKNVRVPYIVTVVESTGQVLSIYRNFRADDPKYNRIEYFVHFKFLPGLGFYGFGLLHMIGGLTRTATEALRQLLDAGTLSNLPAGFKSRGMRVRDDDQPIQPGEFRDVDAPGGNIKDQFQLLPFKEPSQTLFALLNFVVASGQRFAAIADLQVGEGNQQAAVGTTIALLEKGSRVMSAIHKRCYYAMKQEFKILARICNESLPPEYPYDVYGGERIIKALDFDDRIDVLPMADPNLFSMAQRVTLAQTQLQIAQSNPQMHNIYEAYRRVYESLGTKNIDMLLMMPQLPQPTDPAKENSEALKMQLLQVFAEQDHDAHIQAHTIFMQTRMVQINPQVYALMQSHISEHISFKATLEIQQMVLQDARLQMMAQQDPQAMQVLVNNMIAQKVVEHTAQLQQMEAQVNNQQQDPLIRLKQQEIDLRAMDLQRKAQEAQMKEQGQFTRQEAELALDIERLKSQEEAQANRLDVAKAKLNLQAQKQRGQK
jgi:aspartate carbamoyltransferase regulatory subunit